MNDHLKHIVCLLNSEINMYLTEIPKSSAVNIYMIVNATFYYLQQQSM